MLAETVDAVIGTGTHRDSYEFLTGYFGMNFRVLTAHVQGTLWQFVLLGLLLPIASVTLSLLLIHRLERRFGIRRMGQRPS